LGSTHLRSASWPRAAVRAIAGCIGAVAVLASAPTTSFAVDSVDRSRSTTSGSAVVLGRTTAVQPAPVPAVDAASRTKRVVKRTFTHGLRTGFSFDVHESLWAWYDGRTGQFICTFGEVEASATPRADLITLSGYLSIDHQYKQGLSALSNPGFNLFYQTSCYAQRGYTFMQGGVGFFWGTATADVTFTVSGTPPASI
jgi:hypothetical protein